eukprot:g5312.t1
MLSASKLPPRMQLHADKVKAEKEAEARNRRRRKSHVPATRDLPDFERLHSQWDRERAARRRKISVTKAKPFSFSVETSKRSNDERRRIERRKKRIERQRQAKREAREARERQKEEERAMRVQNLPPPAMTKATELRMLRTHEMLEKRKRKAEEEKEFLQEKRERELEAKTRVLPVLEAMEYERTHRRGHVTMEMAMEKAKRKRRNFKRNSERQLEELHRRLEEKIANRPLLFERTHIPAQKQKARNEALAQVASALYGNNSDNDEENDEENDSKDGELESDVKADKFEVFRDEEKDILGDISD